MIDNQSDIRWHSKTAEQALDTLKSSTDGLSDEEAQRRLEKYGRNELHKKKKKTVGKMILEQIMDVMVLILAGAAILSMILGEWAEAVVILAIIVGSSSYRFKVWYLGLLVQFRSNSVSHHHPCMKFPPLPL